MILFLEIPYFNLTVNSERENVITINRTAVLIADDSIISAARRFTKKDLSWIYVLNKYVYIHCYRFYYKKKNISFNAYGSGRVQPEINIISIFLISTLLWNFFFIYNTAHIFFKEICMDNRTKKVITDGNNTLYFSKTELLYLNLSIAHLYLATILFEH